MLTFLSLGCNPPPAEADLDGTRGSRVDVYFNDPGTTADNMWSDVDAVKILQDTASTARSTLDLAVMGFSHDGLISDFVRAWDNGVDVRMVGDAGHLTNDGYETMYAEHIPMVVGNSAHIMHDKFMVADHRFVAGGTANWSDTDLLHNSNNFFFIDSPPIAADFTAEFEQMFSGRFGHSKTELDNGRLYEVGDTQVEVWFSPNEDAMGRILELVEGAEESLRFTIFAFTKDQVGSAFIQKQAEFDELNLADGIDPSADRAERRTVAGVVDRSQLHSNGQYHEVYRLLGAGIDMRLDGNDNSQQPGDYQAGGGRLHSKTMVIDAYGDHPLVITGSFNWSASATVSNDEYLLVFHGPRIAQEFDRYFESIWTTGKAMGETRVADGSVKPGDVVINEVMWYGVHSGDSEGFDEYIELRNMTDQAIPLDMWQITNADDVIVGLPPGSIIPANGTFLIVDHVLEPYVDGAPQDENTAFLSGDLVVNTFNDNRQSRLYLKDGALELILRDPDAVEIDHVGDGGPPFAGGPEEVAKETYVLRSMERTSTPGDGMDPASWYTCTLEEGSGVTNPAYASEVVGTPGAENSPRN